MNCTHQAVAFTVALVTVGFIAGCGSATPTQPGATSPSAEGTGYRLASEPAGAQGVKEARANVQDDQEITLVGRIGGEANPWVSGQAAFVLMDTALQPCGADEGCPTPWDCCCDPNLSPETKAMVKIVDSSGQTVAMDAKQLLGVKELQTVVVHGRAQRDEAGNLTVLADGLFVRNE